MFNLKNNALECFVTIEGWVSKYVGTSCVFFFEVGKCSEAASVKEK